MSLFKGAGVALVTPFSADMSIDFPALRRLVREQIAGGTNYLVVQGTTGESPTLNSDEKKQVLETVLEENNGKLPVVYGIGGNNTLAVVENIRKIPRGVDGILSVAPYYNKPTQAGYLAHYKMLAENTDLPVILYNVPGRTGSNVLAETTLELAEVKNIVAMKEASGNMEQIMEIIRCKPEGFLVLSGDDAITLPLIAAGADGVISVVANSFPAHFSKMVASALNGDFETARKYHYDLLPVTKMFFAEGNPGGVKIALEELGWMKPYMRLPLVQVSDALKAKIIAETKKLG
ncbi:4-hydroxy-tetrahydrodipicolinate synthase [Fluviicola sp.]|jgi:4-hydroxy-tetrahydrodipicolinate synthase|uniref:4-hydroxy-tetrahydrodipicolinate synthase n=1 Tax=Fluviicola sp. TaxID=1917219 RepID=UPI00282A540E|nr:4-hydroxy-tetrahydrodipicolinate synthase [Fluviicola sp.]MDR0801227.1 4-hydroxy-tetrahydrodipicolinate synthase [Fluviicola sp.]